MEKIIEVARGAKGEIIIRFHPPKTLSAPAKKHFQTAGQEFLLGFRSLVEAAAKKPRCPKRGPTKIDVQ